jgi:3-phenylpropionate/trans-cinnamate dioxygenase ferredoxin subunit
MTSMFRLDEIEPSTARRVVVDGVPVAIVRIGDEVHAIDDTCSHAKVSLSDGEVWPDACTLECPKHGSAFSLLTGQPDTLPATQPVRVHRASVVDGVVHVEVVS